LVWTRPYRPREFREPRPVSQVLPAPRPGEPLTAQPGGFLWMKAHLETGRFVAWRAAWRGGQQITFGRKGFRFRKTPKSPWTAWVPVFEDVPAEDWRIGER
jgi:hypothetical protein